MCGIAGIKLKNSGKVDEINVLGLTKNMLYQLTHRGQAGSGFAWPFGNRLEVWRGFGFAEEVYTDILNRYRDRPERLMTHQTIGQDRYPTEGTANMEDLQPAEVSSYLGRVFTLVSNGNLINYSQERALMEGVGGRFDLQSSNEVELMLRWITHHHSIKRSEQRGAEVDFTQSIRAAINYFRGAFSSILMTRNNMFAFMDPWGFRPLIFGETKHFWAFSSESCALDIIGVPLSERRDVEPGEIFHLSDKGLEVFEPNTQESRRRCIFEFIYFARPDSVLWGVPVHKYRLDVGAVLAGYDHDLNQNNVDMIIPIPDSANDVAIGYALAKGMMAQFNPWALVRNHYVGRTFIMGNQLTRSESVAQKFNPKSGIFTDRRVVLVEDSIVRGTTILEILQMVFRAGAREVHLRIASPPKKGPCYYAIATPTNEEHAWHKHGGLQGIINYLRGGLNDFLAQGKIFDLKYLKDEDLPKTVSCPEKYCMACFDGQYPVL